jgi:hypothetical protein
MWDVHVFLVEPNLPLDLVCLIWTAMYDLQILTVMNIVGLFLLRVRRKSSWQQIEQDEDRPKKAFHRAPPDLMARRPESSRELGALRGARKDGGGV